MIVGVIRVGLKQACPHHKQVFINAKSPFLQWKRKEASKGRGLILKELDEISKL